MNLENLNFKNNSEDPTKDDPSYTPEEVGEPRLINDPDSIYPEDLEPVDLLGRDRENIIKALHLDVILHGNLENLFFDSKTKEWKVNIGGTIITAEELYLQRIEEERRYDKEDNSGRRAI